MLPQFKAAGLAVVFDLTAHTFYRLSQQMTLTRTGAPRYMAQKK